MKKKVFARFGTAAVVAAMLLGNASAFGASAAANIQLMGDLDGDQNVTAVDAMKALKIYADDVSQIESNAVSIENYTADIDMNGEISLQDAMSILGYYGKMLSGLKPLWADFREVSYIAGKEPYALQDGMDDTFIPREMYVEIGCATGAPGEDVTIPVYVAGLEGLAGAGMWLTPPEGIELTNISFNADLVARGDANSFITYLPNGSAVWIADKGLNQEVADGTVLIEYTYHIPENAVSGDHYMLIPAPDHTEFVTVDGNVIADYGCTILSGVIAVK